MTCAATTVVAGAGLALSAASVGMTVLGSMNATAGAAAQGAAAQRAGNYNAQIADNEALTAERNRQVALDRATLDARDQSLKNRALQGQIRSAYGASGFGIEGAGLDVLQATAVEGQLDIDKILYKGDIEGANWTDQANSYRNKAALYRMGGASAAAAGEIGASTAILSGFGKAAGTIGSAATSFRGFGGGGGTGGGGFNWPGAGSNNGVMNGP